MTSVIAVRAVTRTVNIMRIGPAVAMLRAIAAAGMALSERSRAVLAVPCLATLWVVERPERSWVVSPVRWSDGPSTRKTRVTTTWLATAADVWGAALLQSDGGVPPGRRPCAPVPRMALLGRLGQGRSRSGAALDRPEGYGLRCERAPLRQSLRQPHRHRCGRARWPMYQAGWHSPRQPRLWGIASGNRSQGRAHPTSGPFCCQPPCAAPSLKACHPFCRNRPRAFSSICRISGRHIWFWREWGEAWIGYRGEAPANNLIGVLRRPLKH